MRKYIILAGRMVRYNLKIIFAGKFVWFLLAAFVFFAFFMFQMAWDRVEINEESIYYLLFFPCMLLIFYPVVFGIQNDEDSRMLEIIFSIPDYRYKVWGARMLMVYVADYVILLLFALLARWLLYPVPVFEMAAQLLFPMLFFGNLAFLFSTFFMNAVDLISRSFWNVFLNPFSLPREMHPLVWQSTILKSRLFLTVGGIVFLLAGLLNLRRREKFI